ncbi:unnamed protein product [Spirodela intermedia]|uniref:Reverse transcriptase Ty1/copia-type domain-containing protein n=2 Tax=Spirodela intermedia TaxID=51605 RepID=A0A7I8J5H3_SPIIN|nr:unnamed protein product [Spirodela intermedia]CAA6665294.1 unnamed protein product [Spirodela intermedia]CAA7402020.1 unnamed protein product [Spirodela intermedia]
MVLLIYVDDIIITGNDEGEIHNLSDCLAQEFDTKTLGRLKYFLGIEVAHSSRGIFISQRKYITDFILSQFIHQPKESHLHAAYRVLHHLKRTPGKWVLIKRSGKVEVEMFTDADYAGSTIDQRSTSDHLTFVSGNLVTWRRICELLSVKNLLDVLKIPLSSPMKIYCDNKSAINLVHNLVQHDCTKHVEIDHHFIREKLEANVIFILYISTNNQLADILKASRVHNCRRLFLSWEWMTSTHKLEGVLSRCS